MNTQIVNPGDLKPGDTVVLSHTSFTVRSVTKVPARGFQTYWIFQEPDGKLAFCAHADDPIKVAKAKRQRRKSAA